MIANIDLLESLGQIAGIGGIALGVFLLLFRNVIQKKIFPQLTKKQGFRVILLFLILTWSIALAGIAAWVMTENDNSPDSEPALTNQNLTATLSLWGVDLDTKGRMIDSTTAKANNETQLAKDLSQWIAEKLDAADTGNLPKIEISIDVPANLETEMIKITRQPDGPLELLMWDTSGNAKFRAPLDQEVIKHLHHDFYIEIKTPGFASKSLEVKWGSALKETAILSPAPIQIGIEQFKGNDSFGDQLAGELNGFQRISITSPEMLATIREQIREHNEFILSNPMAQEPLRKLGVDYIISGSVKP